MPDPFLTQLEFDSDYRNSEEIAVSYGAKIQHSGRLVFLYCKGAAGWLLARIDCTNYPEKLPDVTFLNPSTRQPTAESRFWPVGIAPVPGPQGFGLCIEGTATYEKHHAGSLLVRHSLATIVELVILCCSGQVQKLRFIPVIARR
jgi:hypothetical protein